MRVDNIKWTDHQEDSFEYIDLSSVSRDDHKIINTNEITINNAPSRAKQIVHKDDVLFGTTRPQFQRITIIPQQLNNQICSSGFCVMRADKDIVLPRWIFYMISTSSFKLHVERYEKGASYPSISDGNVMKYKLLIPSLKVQNYIVSILDKFDTLVHDLNQGLPKEIELRQKQYEYYREKLLDFPK